MVDKGHTKTFPISGNINLFDQVCIWRSIVERNIWLKHTFCYWTNPNPNPKELHNPRHIHSLIHTFIPWWLTCSSDWTAHQRGCGARFPKLSHPHTLTNQWTSYQDSLGCGIWPQDTSTCHCGIQGSNADLPISRHNGGRPTLGPEPQPPC